MAKWGPPHWQAAIGDGAFVPVSLTAVGAAWAVGGRRDLDPRVRRGWRRLALGLLCFALGDIAWFGYEALLGQDPFPSVADVFYLMEYPVVLWAVLSFPVQDSSRHARTRLWLDALTVMLCGAMITWYLILGPAALKYGASSLEAVLTLAYPVGDHLLIFAVAYIAFYQGSGVAARSLKLLSGGLLLFVIANTGFGMMSLADAYSAGDWPDTLWMAGTVLVIAAGQWQVLSPRNAEADPEAPWHLKWAVLLAPYVAVTVSCGLLLYVVRLDLPRQALLVGVVAVMAVVVLRQVLTLRENGKLLRAGASLAEELRANEARFRSLVQNSSDIIAVLTAGLEFRYVSPSIERTMGLLPESLLGASLLAGLHPDDRDHAVALMGEGSGSGDWRWRHADGSWRYVEATVNSQLHDPDLVGIVLNIRDVSERRRLEEELRRHALYDALTGLANRALIQNRMEHALAALPRRREPLAILMLDLDGFKTVNDSLGYTAGDQVLAGVAGRLLAFIPRTDTVARLGADEFAILLEGAGVAEAEEMARQVTEKLQPPLVIQGKQVHVRVSMGIAVTADDQATPDELLRHADAAMHEAKSRGKGRYVLFEPHMAGAALERLELEADLRTALATGAFFLQYQPIVFLGSGQITGVEALVRWAHPRRGRVEPGQFIPMAEETGLITVLGHWVLEEACRQAHEWLSLDLLAGPFYVSVNLSARQLRDPNLLGAVRQTLSQYPLPPGTLLLEVTESTLVTGSDAEVDTLRRLRELGVRIAIDDFGTGYSSLSYLRSLPVDIVKIDRSFVSQLGTGFRESALMRGIVEMAHALGLETIAEGIEDAEQARQLHMLRCVRGQGYHFARPAPPEDVARWLATKANLGR